MHRERRASTDAPAGGARRGRSANGSPANDGAGHGSEAQLRSWLRVPVQLALPGWVRSRLGEPVAEAGREREGTEARSAVFGVIDLETTGTSARSSILEIGLVVQRAGRVLERFETFVDPGSPVPWSITQLTGIEQGMIEDAPDPASALSALGRVLDSHGVQALVAHNAPFDRRFIERARTEAGSAWELPPFLCSLRLARRLVRARRYGLAALVEQLSIPERPRHRALGDAEMTAALWWELLGRARLRGVHTLEGLTDWASPRRGRPRRPPVRTVDVPPAIG
jgi:DNA polymerase-3 subunit epsilon